MFPWMWFVNNWMLAFGIGQFQECTFPFFRWAEGLGFLSNDPLKLLATLLFAFRRKNVSGLGALPVQKSGDPFHGLHVGDLRESKVGVEPLIFVGLCKGGDGPPVSEVPLHRERVYYTNAVRLVRIYGPPFPLDVHPFPRVELEPQVLRLLEAHLEVFDFLAERGRDRVVSPPPNRRQVHGRLREVEPRERGRFREYPPTHPIGPRGHLVCVQWHLPTTPNLHLHFRAPAGVPVRFDLPHHLFALDDLQFTCVSL